MASIIWKAVAEYGKTHSIEETDRVARKLLGLGPRSAFSPKISGKDKDVWRTTEEGHHIKLESETGEIKAGMGGKFNGETLKKAFSGAKPKKSRPKSVDETAEMIAGKNNLFSNSKFRESSKKWTEARKESDKLYEKTRELRDQLAKEVSFPDQESRELGRQYAEMFGWYTDKGKEIKKELDQIEEERSQIQKEAAKNEHQADLMKAQQSLKELQAWEEPPLKKTDKTKFDGFTLESDIADIRNAIGRGVAQIVEMSPKEYLERCAHQIFNGSTLEHTIAGTDPAKFNKYADQMEEGEEFSIPYLNFDSRQQEGRHRALAAMMNGYETIPVAVIGNPSPKWVYEGEAKSNLFKAEQESLDDEKGTELPDDLLLEEINAADAEPVEDEEIWRTSEEGRHFKFESETGEIKAGFGGKFNGKKMGESWGGSKKSSGSGKSKQYHPDLIAAAHNSKTPAEFWYNMPESEKGNYKSIAEIQKAHEDILKNTEKPQPSPYAPPKGTKADMPKKCKVPDKPAEIKLYDNPDDTATAHAGTTGVIEVNLRNLDQTNVDGVIAHEAAHQLSNSDPELQQAIIMNYGDVLGRYNQEKGHFEGIFGEYNPEEAFATGFSNYRNHPESMKEKYPDAFEFFDNLAKNQPESVAYIDKTVEAAKAALKENSSSQASTEKTKWQTDLEKRKAKALTWDSARQAEFLNRQGFLDYDAAVEAMENGTAGMQIEKYFAIQEHNGDPTPTKKVLDANEVRADLRRRLAGGSDWTQARKDMMREFTGQSAEEVERTYHEMDTWFGGGWSHADTDTLDTYIDQDGTCKGPIYRGLKFDEAGYQKFMKNLEPGSRINMRGMNSSWSTSEEVAWDFYHGAEREVKITCVSNRTASPVDFISSKGEYEVLAHSRAQWTVLGVKEGDSRTEITVIETGEFMSKEDRDKLKQEHANDSAPERESKHVSLAQRMQEQSSFMTVDLGSLEFVNQMKKEHPEWFR